MNSGSTTRISGANLKERIWNAMSSFFLKLYRASAYAAGTPTITETTTASPDTIRESSRYRGYGVVKSTIR